METRATIVIAARNAAATIRRAVESAVAEDGCSIVLVDDFSTDDTVAVAEDIGGERLRVVRPVRHQSLGLTRQTGLDAVKTRFGVWLDADDELLPGRVERLVSAMESDTAELATDTIELVDGASSRFLKLLTIPMFLREHHPLARLFERNYLQGPGCLGFRTEFAQGIGYDPAFHGGEDMDFLLRSVAEGARVCLLDEPGYRIHAYSTSVSRQRERQLDMYRLCLLKHGYDAVRELFVDAGYSEWVSMWGLLSMALFRRDFDAALELLKTAESLVVDRHEVLEPSGPCPMTEGWRVAFFRGTTMLLFEPSGDAELWLERAEALQPTPEGANNLGVAKAKNGKQSEAQELFRVSLSRFPEYSDARANREATAPSRITTHPLRKEPSRGDY